MIKDQVIARLRANPIPETQYFLEEHAKKSICLHHTAGGSADSSINSWINDKQPKVATCVIIDRDGTIVQAFASQYWAYSLGLSTPNYVQIERQTIGIEIANYGGLKKIGEEYYNAYGGKIKPENVYDCGFIFRGFRYFEKYTDKQIDSVRLLLLYWNERYKIPLDYHPNMWDYNQSAILGAAGIWSHTSYRKDKSDCFPQPELIAMLKGLKRP